MIDNENIKIDSPAILTPEQLRLWSEEYPDLADIYSQVLDQCYKLKKLLSDFEAVGADLDLVAWNEQQKAVHDNLIIKTIDYLNKLEGHEPEIAKRLKAAYNQDIGSRVLFAQLAVRA
jgi:hypothetical protein